MRMNKKIISLIALLILFPASIVYAACSGSSPTWNCSSDTTSAQLNTCISGATTGDTINVASGSGTWATTVSLSKAVSLVGAGIDSTNITCSSNCITIDPSFSDTTNLYRFSGFTLTQGANNGVVLGHLSFNPTSDVPAMPKVRIDHIKFTGITGGQSIYSYSPLSAVVDNSQFLGSGGSTSYYPVRCATGNNYVPYEQNTYNNMYSHWDTGTNYTIYFENNTFTNLFDGGSQMILADCQYAHTGYVFRYNTISGSHDAQPLFDMHGNYAANMFACFGIELYGNDISAPSGNVTDQRAGKGMVFFNTTDNTMGYRVRDEACPSAEPVASQVMHDTYYFNNRVSLSGSIQAVTVSGTISGTCNGLTGIPTLGRDAFSNASDPGVGCGTSLPGTCTVGAGYWIPASGQEAICTDLTDYVGKSPTKGISGTLYKCTATNTWTPFYTPYTYPHPFRGETVATNYSISGGTISGGSIK
jgi:hypothetical protein